MAPKKYRAMMFADFNLAGKWMHMKEYIHPIPCGLALVLKCIIAEIIAVGPSLLLKVFAL